MCEGVGIEAQGLVDVEENNVELSVVSLEGLTVVAWPVVAAEEHLGGHVVDELVHIDHLLDLVVGGFVACAG